MYVAPHPATVVDAARISDRSIVILIVMLVSIMADSTLGLASDIANLSYGRVKLVSGPAMLTRGYPARR